MRVSKKAILAASFGTSSRTVREASIGAVERTIRETFPEYEVRRAFTSQKIINKVKREDGEIIHNVTEALEQLTADGYDTLIVQPTHVMSGFEYEDMMKEIAPWKSRFASLACGKPLLSDDRDDEIMVDILVKETAGYQAEKTAIVFMGHGTGHEANAVYARLEEKLRRAGHNNHYIGTVEGTPSLEDVVETVNAGNYDHVVLLPLMIVAGDHACHDMAGDEEDSWKMTLIRAGYQVTCVMKGLGEYPGVQAMFADHVRASIRELEMQA